MSLCLLKSSFKYGQRMARGGYKSKKSFELPMNDSFPGVAEDSSEVAMSLCLLKSSSKYGQRMAGVNINPKHHLSFQ